METTARIERSMQTDLFYDSMITTKENIIEERSIRIFGDFLESKWRECDAHSTEI